MTEAHDGRQVVRMDLPMSEYESMAAVAAFGRVPGRAVVS